MKRWITTLVMAPVLLGLVAPVMAQPGGVRPGGFPFWKNEKIVEKLALTPDQIARLNEIDYTFRMDSLDPDTRLKRARLELDHLLSQDTCSADDTQRMGEEISAATAALAKLGVNKQISVRQVLSSDQWSQLEQGRQHRRRQMRRDGRGGRQEGGGPPEGGQRRGMMRMHRPEGAEAEIDQD
ncbi:MAG: hypothetical protein V1789_02625 [PVC group bacterium]